MGNTHSDVTNNIKAQADALENESYRLVDVKGGGELVRLMKDPAIRKNKAKMDEEIIKFVRPCLYNSNGESEDIPIQQIVYHRSTNKEKFKKNMPTSMINLDKLMGRKKGALTKKVCWDINKRGAVGETPLHLCLLVGSTLHKDLAKRMVRLFPELVNDFYLSDEYYGENALHMAIVNEDPNMVKFLLSYNSDLHQRCCGKFFCSDDQKNSRQESLTQEYPILPTVTNYAGFSYYGEYALSFAAVMDQFDCVRLLFARGVDPNKQDSNGNTVLHMLVIHNKLTMFEYLLNLGARLDIKNNQNHTPLTLAAQLARLEIFQYVLQKMRTVYWVYADISCAAYPLTDLDTISENGSTNSTSVLYSIVNSDSEQHLKLLDGLVLDLLQEKWKRFIKKRFYLELLFFLLFFILTCTAIYLKRSYFTYLRENLSVSTHTSANVTTTTVSINKTACINITTKAAYLLDSCKCIYLYPVDPNMYVRYAIEFLVLLMAVTVLILSVKEIYIEKFKLYFRILIGSPTKFLYLISCFLILFIVPVRLVCDPSTEDILSVLALLLMTMHFLYYCRGFRVVGPFVLMVEKMMKGDLMRFFIIYSVFLLGFSQALYMACGYGIENEEHPMFRTPLEAMLNMFILSLGEFKDTYNQLDGATHPTLGRIFFIIFMVIVGIILLNLLIAMMGNTYAEVYETKNEWLRQWAKVVLAIEQSVYHVDRLKFQQRYSHLLETGQRALIVRWKQSEAEREQLVESKVFFREYAELIPEMPKRD